MGALRRGQCRVEAGELTFSDGVSEAMNEAEEEYGDEGILASLAAMTETQVEPQLQARVRRCLEWPRSTLVRRAVLNRRGALANRDGPDDVAARRDVESCVVGATLQRPRRGSARTGSGRSTRDDA